MTEQRGSTGRGRFITVEGIEGAGKSTQVAAIRDILATRNIKAVTTREPGGTPLSEAVRELLLNPDNRGMATDTELLLVFAARAEHLQRVVLPALDAGHWVVCDRFTDATFAYQGGGRGADARRIEILEDWVQDSLRPDLTLLLDLPVALGFERVESRGRRDRFERENRAFFERIRNTYLDRARAAPNRYRIIDAAQPVAKVTEAVVQAIGSML